MKIGIVAWDLNISGGTQRQALELALHLQKMGHSVKVYTVYFNKKRCYPDISDKLDIEYLYSEKETDNINDNISVALYSRVLINFFHFWIQLFKTERLCKKLADLIDKKTDLICCHDYIVYAVGSKYKNKTRKSVIWQMNDLPVFRNDFKSLKGIIKFFLSPIRGDLVFGLKHIGYIRTMDEIVVMDYLNKEKLKSNLGLESTIVRNGLDIEKFKFKERALSGGRLNIMSNGIFFPWRRIEDLIDALKMVKDAGIEMELNHIGTDERCKWYAKEIYNKVKKLNLSDRVEFRGHIGEEELIKFYSTSDIFVFPNHPQTWGLAVFEAMGCGTPVIVSTGCGASEVLTNGENALLVPPKSPAKIAEAIMKLKKDPQLWKKLSVNGRKFVEENIRWDMYAENMMKVFEKVLKEKRIKDIS